MNQEISWFDIIFSSSFLINLVFIAIIYSYFSYCLMKIAKKQGIENPWLAWIPLANLYIMGKAAGKSTAFIVFLFVPIINLLLVFIAWFGIAERMNRPSWTAILLLIPFVNLAIPWYYASGNPTGYTPQAETPKKTKQQKHKATQRESSKQKAVSNECPSCGSVFLTTDKFCGECGYDLSKIETVSSEETKEVKEEAFTKQEVYEDEKTKKKSVVVPVLASSFVTLVLVVGGFLLYNYFLGSNTGSVNNPITQYDEQPDDAGKLTSGQTGYGEDKFDNTGSEDIQQEEGEEKNPDEYDDFITLDDNANSGETHNEQDDDQSNQRILSLTDFEENEEEDIDPKIFSLGAIEPVEDEEEDDTYNEEEYNEENFEKEFNFTESELNEEVEVDIGNNERIIITQRDFINFFGKNTDQNSIEFSGPKITKKAKPNISSAVKGDVELEVLVNIHGYIEETKFISGKRELYNDAMITVSKYKIDPATFGGNKVKSWTKITVTF